MEDKYEKEIIDSSRLLIAYLCERAKSGHPGSAISLTPLFFVLYKHIVRNLNVKDVVVLSNGHVCLVQYIFEFYSGRLTFEELLNYRQLCTTTPGHPEKSQNIAVTTGPLGQGLANSVGFAISFKKQRLDNIVFCIFGDGCYQEGISHESFGVAASLGLNNIIFIYDSNRVTIDGSTDLTMRECPKSRFLSYGFHIIEVQDGDSIECLKNVLEEAVESSFIGLSPIVVIIHTTIATSTLMAGNPKTHGAPLGNHVLEDMMARSNVKCIDSEHYSKYKTYFEQLPYIKISDKYRDKFLVEEALMKQDVITESISTREHMSRALNACFDVIKDSVINGSADLSSSCINRPTYSVDFTRNNHNGNYIHYGIREHGMLGICNGIACSGKYTPICSTFLNFMSYGYPALRLAAMMRLTTITLLTHDSIFLGEDGPTHQPIETIGTLRSTINLFVFRPCNQAETYFSLLYGLTRNDGPTAIILSRQEIAYVEGVSFDTMKNGAYKVKGDSNPDVVLVSSGSELPIAISVGEYLKNTYSIRSEIISMFSFDLIDLADTSYRNSIFNRSVCTLSIEASNDPNWQRYADYCYGVSVYGVCGNYKDLVKYFGFDTESVGEWAYLKFLEHARLRKDCQVL